MQSEYRIPLELFTFLQLLIQEHIFLMVLLLSLLTASTRLSQTQRFFTLVSSLI